MSSDFDLFSIFRATGVTHSPFWLQHTEIPQLCIDRKYQASVGQNLKPQSEVTGTTVVVFS